MATLVLVSGGRRHPIAKADIDKHPGSLLQSLMASTAAAAAGDPEVTLDLDQPSFGTSPFRAWPAAVGITAELFSQGNASAATLSEQLKRETSADLLTELRELLDYLALPGPLCKWLPACSSIPLRHIGVRDLHVQAANAVAAAAVETMLDAATEGSFLMPLPMCTSKSRIQLEQVADECGEAVGHQPLMFAALSKALEREVARVPIDGRTGGLKSMFVEATGSSDLPMWVLYHAT